MTTVSIEQAQAQLADLIARLKPGEALLITDHDRPIARLVAEEKPSRRPGSAIGKFRVIEEDESHLDDFEEDMR